MVAISAMNDLHYEQARKIIYSIQMQNSSYLLLCFGNENCPLSILNDRVAISPNVRLYLKYKTRDNKNINIDTFAQKLLQMLLFEWINLL